MRADLAPLVDKLPAAYGASVAAPQTSRQLLAAAERARSRSDEYVSAEHLLLALAEQSGDVADVLAQNGAGARVTADALESLRGSQHVTTPDPAGTFRQ